MDPSELISNRVADAARRRSLSTSATFRANLTVEHR
jgi:hypothetical protein